MDAASIKKVQDPDTAVVDDAQLVDSGYHPELLDTENYTAQNCSSKNPSEITSALETCAKLVNDLEINDTLHPSCELLHVGRKSFIWRTVYSTQKITETDPEDPRASFFSHTPPDQTSGFIPAAGSKSVVVKRYNSNNPKLKASEEFVDAHILKEIRLLKYLDHDNIIKLYDVIVAESETKNDDNVCVCVEAVDTSLAYFQQQGIIIKDIYQACLLLYQVLRAVKYMHFAGIAHGNLRLSTMLVNVGSLEVKLCDFQHATQTSQTTAAIERDISDIFLSLEKLFSKEYVIDDPQYQSFRSRQLSSQNILLNTAFFQQFDLYDSNLDEPDQIFGISMEPFPWHQLEERCPSHTAIYTLVHLISLEARRHDTATSFQKGAMTSEDLAIACELEHGVQCGDSFSQTKMRFTYADHIHSTEDVDLRCNTPMHVSTTSTSDIFDQIFTSRPPAVPLKTQAVTRIEEEEYAASPCSTFRPINERLATVDSDNSHKSEDDDVLCDVIHHADYDRYCRYHPSTHAHHNYSQCSSGIHSDHSRTPTQSSLSSRGAVGSTSNRCSSLSPMHCTDKSSAPKSTSSSRQAAVPPSNTSSSGFLYDIGCGNVDGCASANDNVVACSISEFDERYDVVDWLAHFKQ
jgi:serine/threonine protein kinase